MKKISSLLILSFITFSLFSYSHGTMFFSFGAEDTISPEIDHSLYGMEFNYERSWFYGGGDIGLSSDLSLNLPVSYRLGKSYSKPFRTFNATLSLDYSFKAAYNLKPLTILLGPSVRTNLFFTNSKTVVAEMLYGIENSIILDFPLSSTIGINTGFDFITDFYRVDFIKNGARGFISPRFDISLFIGISVYYNNGFTFN